jgi:hypothetical protein
LCCLSFFDLRILTILLVSAKSSLQSCSCNYIWVLVIYWYLKYSCMTESFQRQAWVHETSLTLPRLIEVSLPSQKSERSCIFVLMVSICLRFYSFSIKFSNCSDIVVFLVWCWNCSDIVVFLVFLLNYRTVPTLWYFLFFIFKNAHLMNDYLFLGVK